MKDMCADCGADLQKLDGPVGQGAGVAMVHAIPELKVSVSEAASLGREDLGRLVTARKLVLLVDLDQTLIHTTNDNIPPNLRDVHHFQLSGHPRAPWYHTRLRPGTTDFLENISKLYELHICTFGARLYAHQIARFLDPKSKYFSHRILSRDECFDARSKTANMSALFPCGDSMVCIIDDREDVWNFAPNLVHVKPYHFFKNTGDINAPPGLTKRENDGKAAEEKTKAAQVAKKEPAKAEVEDSSSEDEPPQTEKAADRRDSIDMPQFDSNSRGATELNDNQEKKTEEETSKVEESSKDDLTSAGDAPKEVKVPKEPKVEGEVGDDLEISDSDSSTGKRSRDISDTEGAGDEEKKKKVVVEKPKSAAEEVEDNDDYLLYLEDILRTVHKAYYDLHDQAASASPATPAKAPDLKMVIPYVRRKTLHGVSLVMSGVVPTHVPLERSKPYLLARALGASVTTEVCAATTHLVAARLGTAKVNDARRRAGVALVTPDWLWACAERWERVDERLFTLSKTSSVTRRPPAHCSSPEIAFAERCADIDLGLEAGLARQPSVAEADPFLSFSTEDLAGMDKEVEDILSGEESDSEGEGGEGGVQGAGWQGGDEEGDSSSQDSMTGAAPRGHKRDREECGPWTVGDSEEDTNPGPPERRRKGSEGEGGSEERGGEEDWGEMGAELERELGN